MTRHPEARFATQDGFIWPVHRGLMQDRDCIRARMAEDLARLRRELAGATLTMDDLVTRCGWTRRHVEAHACAAFDLFKASKASIGAEMEAA